MSNIETNDKETKDKKATKDLNLTAMPTPNPNTIKFLMDFQFLPVGSLDFTDSKKAKNSPLPSKLLTIKGIEGVLIGTNFVSISKHSDAGWDTILETATDIIKTTVGVEDPLIESALIEKIEESMGDDNEIVKRIKEILDHEIRPAIAMDGGDCQFVSFEEGVVTLQLQGACSSCPSATMTLKMGIENRLKEEIPEVTEVVQTV
jgi:Fe-S cluster biogenesis protein NfuA